MSDLQAHQTGTLPQLPQTQPFLNEFTLFPLLPTELRLKIYNIILTRPRILKISYSMTHSHYISHTPPPPLLSLCTESRTHALKTHSYFSIGSFNTVRNPQPHPSFPINPLLDTLYIAPLTHLLLLPNQLSTFLYHLSTSPSRHSLTSLALDFRVFQAAEECGFLAIVAKMRGLRELVLVVEFGWDVKGEVLFGDVGDERMDLRWVAGKAEGKIEEERGRVWAKGIGEMGTVTVKCVLLKRGGEGA